MMEEVGVVANLENVVVCVLEVVNAKHVMGKDTILTILMG